MRIVRKFPPNPNLLVYLVDEQQTREMAEFYGNRDKSHRPIARSLLEIAGTRRVQITRYEIRVFKNRGVEWSAILSSIEAVVLDMLPVSAIEEYFPGEPVDKKFAMHTGAKDKKVYEGCAMSQQNPIAKELFCINGIERVIIEEDSITVRKSHLFPWDELLPRINTVFSNREFLPKIPK